MKGICLLTRKFLALALAKRLMVGAEFSLNPRSVHPIILPFTHAAGT